MGTLHKTGDESDCDNEEIQTVVWWQHSEHDLRAIGPEGEVFPRPDGWVLDGKDVSLDSLSVRRYTRALTMRRFIRPACQQAWETHDRLGPYLQRLGWEHLPWSEIWKMKSFYETPRDRMTGLKLQHRNLYVAARDPLGDVGCMACGEKETQLHLAECRILQIEYWQPLIDTLCDMGMTPPADITIFIATGVLTEKTTAGKYFAGAWFIAWRCIYAEIVNARIEKHTLDTQRALKRCVSMWIGRLYAYGLQWRNWVIAGRYQREDRIIPRKHRDKKLMTQEDDGSYWVHDAIYSLADDLQLKYSIPHPPVTP